MERASEKPLLHELVLDRRTILSIGTSDLKSTPRSLSIVRDIGIREPRVLTMLLLWYLFSGITLFLNKFVLNAFVGGAGLLVHVLFFSCETMSWLAFHMVWQARFSEIAGLMRRPGIMQVLITTLCSFVQMYYPCGMWTPIRHQVRPPRYKRNMALVGVFRFLTIWFGLIALDYVAVSFAEVVKCSAPIFTVMISRVVTGEPATLPVVLSLVPVMAGLALCSAHELSFNLTGFLAALITNISECLQSVYSKLLVSGEKYHCSPAELQFYSGSASLVLILPCLYFVDLENVMGSLSFTTMSMIVVDGLSFHFQSITANVLMGYLSPTTYSVSNTVKRGLLIWCSILIFGNSITLGAWIGTGLMLAGVLLYNRAKAAVVHAVSTSD